MWKPITEAPESGRRIIALYGDGSGARLFLTCDAGPSESDGISLIDHDGDETFSLNDLDAYSSWAYLPDGTKLWFEIKG